MIWVEKTNKRMMNKTEEVIQEIMHIEPLAMHYSLTPDEFRISFRNTCIKFKVNSDDSVHIRLHKRYGIIGEIVLGSKKDPNLIEKIYLIIQKHYRNIYFTHLNS